MKRRLKQVVLPLFIISSLAALVCAGIIFDVQVTYREASNREIANLVGEILTEYPELDTSQLIQALEQRGAGEQASVLGEEVFRSYGYLPSDNFSKSSTFYTNNLFMISVLGIVLACIAAGLFFWWRDWRNERRIVSLVEYLNQLHDHIYDLRLDENSESELSILTNELYKIMVSLKQAAEQNQLRSQNLETALADISHQLRTPLTSLQAMIDNIYEDPAMPVAVRQDFLRSSSRQITAMSNLVMTLLSIARFDNGSIRLDDREVSAHILVERIQQNLEVLADLQDITLEVAGDLKAKLKLDLRWQTEALTNITKNCIEHSAPGQKVLITVEDCPLYLRINIQDFGEGIAATDLRHIFERFYKAKNAKADSVGIGLAFAKTIIEADGGQIKVSSKLGSGTKFTITYFKN